MHDTYAIKIALTIEQHVYVTFGHNRAKNPKGNDESRAPDASVLAKYATEKPASVFKKVQLLP
jgi:hypothetical protein